MAGVQPVSLGTAKVKRKATSRQDRPRSAVEAAEFSLLLDVLLSPGMQFGSRRVLEISGDPVKAAAKTGCAWHDIVCPAQSFLSTWPF